MLKLGKLRKEWENLIKILEMIELPKKKKPLNLFRKMQILYHDKFKKGYLR